MGVINNKVIVFEIPSTVDNLYIKDFQHIVVAYEQKNIANSRHFYQYAFVFLFYFDHSKHKRELFFKYSSKTTTTDI